MSDEIEGFQFSTAWDVAVRYHEFKKRKLLPAELRRLRTISARAVFERAKEVLGSITHPVQNFISPWTEVPVHAEQVDFDFEETLENLTGFGQKSPRSAPLETMTYEDIWMEYALPRKQSVVLSVDTSLSMTGEKLALTAVSLAVVLLQFSEDRVGIVAFENEAKVIKSPNERISIQELLERFLDVPAQGYTHLEEGLKAALRQVGEIQGGSRGQPASTVLLTDGKYTAGRDPVYLAPRFPHLVVLKMGEEQASLSLCEDLALRGKGTLKEVRELTDLPQVMYGVVKDLLRGHS